MVAWDGGARGLLVAGISLPGGAEQTRPQGGGGLQDRREEGRHLLGWIAFSLLIQGGLCKCFAQSAPYNQATFVRM